MAIEINFLFNKLFKKSYVNVLKVIYITYRYNLGNTD